MIALREKIYPIEEEIGKKRDNIKDLEVEAARRQDEYTFYD